MSAAILPPLAYQVCVRALRDLQKALEDHHWEEGTSRASKVLTIHHALLEADPYAVGLAAHLGAYVLGLDSDFVVLNREGYLGYIPLDEVRWVEMVEEEEDVKGESEDEVEEDEGFTVVGKKGRARKKGTARGSTEDSWNVETGLVPPSCFRSQGDKNKTSERLTTLQLSVYPPSALSAHFALPPSLLPLVGAFLGNDYTTLLPASSASSSPDEPKTGFMNLFSEKGQNPGERIERVAQGVRRVLESALASNSGNKRKSRRGKKVGSVMELIEACADVLAVRPLDSLPPGHAASLGQGVGERGLKERVVEKIVEATLQYAVPDYDFSTFSLPLAPPSADYYIPEPSSPATTTDYTNDTETNSESQTTGAPSTTFLPTLPPHLHAPYAASLLSPRLLDAFVSKTIWARMGFEDPDRESVGRWVGTELRIWACAILGVGRGHDAEELEGDLESQQVTGAAQGNDVTDADADTDGEVGRGLAMLKGRLKALEGDKAEESEDEDEEVDVVEESSDEHEDHEDETNADTSDRKENSFTIIHYSRVGTRFVPTPITIPSVASLLASLEPPFLVPPPPPPSSQALTTGQPMEDVDEWKWEDSPYRWPLHARISLFLRILKSDVPTIRALIEESALATHDDANHDRRRDPQITEQREKLGAVLAVRWIVLRLAERVQEAGGVTGRGKERDKERWTRDEAKAFLKSFRWTSASPLGGEAHEKTPSEIQAIPIDEHNIQLTAQVTAAMDAIEHLAQALFLTEEFPNPVRRFSGKKFHTLLNSTSTSASVSKTEGPKDRAIQVLWDACKEGLYDAFRGPVVKKSKKERKEERRTDASNTVVREGSQGKSKGKPIGGKFGLLADMEG